MKWGKTKTLPLKKKITQTCHSPDMDHELCEYASNHLTKVSYALVFVIIEFGQIDYDKVLIVSSTSLLLNIINKVVNCIGNKLLNVD